MWKNGFVTDDLALAELQRQAFEKGDFKGYLTLNYVEDRPLALKYLLQHGIRDRYYWEYAYAYGTGNFQEYIPLLRHFNENVKISVRPTKEGLVRVYRGINENSSPMEQSFSWTTNKKVALKFANFQTKVGSTLVSGLVHPKHIQAQIKIRKEQELIINPKHVKVIKENKLYTPITARELNTFKKHAKTSEIDAFLTYGVLKEHLKNHKDYIKHMRWLPYIKRKLLGIYGDFINTTEAQFSIILRRSVTIVPLIKHRVDVNLMIALRNVERVLSQQVASHDSPILTRYLLYGSPNQKADKVLN